MDALDLPGNTGAKIELVALETGCLSHRHLFPLRQMSSATSAGADLPGILTTESFRRFPGKPCTRSEKPSVFCAEGVLVLESEDQSSVLMDCCLYDWIREGKNVQGKSQGGSLGDREGGTRRHSDT